MARPGASGAISESSSALLEGIVSGPGQNGSRPGRNPENPAREGAPMLHEPGHLAHKGGTANHLLDPCLEVQSRS